MSNVTAHDLKDQLIAYWWEEEISLLQAKVADQTEVIAIWKGQAEQFAQIIRKSHEHIAELEATIERLTNEKRVAVEMLNAALNS